MISEFPFWKSRKFWIATVDAVIILVGIWAGALLVPDQAGLVIASVAALQVPVVALITAITVQNVKLSDRWVEE